MIVAPTTRQAVPRFHPALVRRRVFRRGLGDAGVAIPWGFVGPWNPPASYGNLKSTPINLTAGMWPSGIPQVPAYWDWATDQGQQIEGTFWKWGTPVSFQGGPCAPLNAPVIHPITSGPSTSVGDASISAPTDPFLLGSVTSCTPGPVVAPTPSRPAPAAPAPAPVLTAAPSVAAPVNAGPVTQPANAAPEPAVSYQTGAGPSGTSPAAASGFSLSDIPWWAWVGAAAVGLYMVTK
jgi:hypothetical protein